MQFDAQTWEDLRLLDHGAFVSLKGHEASIQTYYQQSLLFRDEQGRLLTSVEAGSSNKAVACFINGYQLPTSYGKQFYQLLWYKYLKAHPELEALLLTDFYQALFQSNQPLNWRLETFKTYTQDELGQPSPKDQRGQRLKTQFQPLVDVLTQKNTVIVEPGDLTQSFATILAHQVNAKGVMGSGVAKAIRTHYPAAYQAYLTHPKLKQREILGTCQFVTCGSRIIANLFSQFDYGRNPQRVYTDYQALREALVCLKEFAKAHQLSVAMPFKIGCGLANGDWDGVVLPMIQEVFSDYYVILYQT